MSTSMKVIESVGDDRVRVSGDITLNDLYQTKPDLELYVEPLSASQPLAEFVVEGGMGFGTVPVGTFGGQICSFKGIHDGLEFGYGLGTTPLYNTGYSLQRVIEGPNAGLLSGKFEQISEMVVRARKKTGRKIEFKPAAAPEFPKQGDADAYFVNAKLAETIGKIESGMIIAIRTDGAGDEAWSKRFAVDSMPSNQSKFMALTQESGSKALFETHASKCPDGMFMALKVHVGVLVAASGPTDGVKELGAKAAGLQLTWQIGAH